MAHRIGGIKRDVTIKSVWRDGQLVRAGPCGQDAPSIEDLKGIGIDDDPAPFGRDRERQRRLARRGRTRDQNRFVVGDVFWIDHLRLIGWRYIARSIIFRRAWH